MNPTATFPALAVVAWLVGCAPPTDSEPGPARTEAQVRALLKEMAALWNEAAREATVDCDPNRESGEICIDRFKLEVASEGLGLVRHQRLLEDYDPDQLAAFARVMGDGWADREEICREPMLTLMRDSDVRVAFKYYARDMTPLFDHEVGQEECEELLQLMQP